MHTVTTSVTPKRMISVCHDTTLISLGSSRQKYFDTSLDSSDRARIAPEAGMRRKGYRWGTRGVAHGLESN